MGEKKLKLAKKIFIEGEITTKTGLHIGGSSTGLNIGGADKVVVRNPVTNLPYIPGSSLKGKMRSLLEKSLGLVDLTSEKKKKGEEERIEWTGSLCKDPEKDVVQLFGFPADETKTSDNYAPTRVIFRDADLINAEELEALENTDMYCTEIKTEVSIDRLTAKANPRNFERVPSGARFSLSIVLDIYSVDLEPRDEGQGKNGTRADSFLNLLSQGLKLIEDDYLGGQGTRGYGRVKFKIKSVKERTAEDYINNVSAREAGEYKEYFTEFMD